MTSQNVNPGALLLNAADCHGIVMRLNPETPARQSRKPGRPPMTWITTIQQYLYPRETYT